MHRYLLPVSILALAGAIAFWSIGGADAGVDNGKSAQCFPTSVLEAGGAEGAQFAGGAQVFLQGRVDAGRKNFMTLKSSKGAEILCMW